jgi:hypothetical protein
MDKDLSPKELVELMILSVLISVAMCALSMVFKYFFRYLLTQI